MGVEREIGKTGQRQPGVRVPARERNEEQDHEAEVHGSDRYEVMHPHESVQRAAVG